MSDPVSWPVLSMAERRVLGVLVEKAKTTPDVYPLSLNSLTTGANQKSNRDPVLNLSEDEVLDTLTRLLSQGLVTRIQGGRVERWKHNLYDHWTSDKVGLAVLTELLLRGPQTEGELRTRASRMEPIEDLPALRKTLEPLLERKLVHFLGPEGRRGTLIAHGFHAPREMEAFKARSMSLAEAPEEPRPVPSPAASSGLAEVKDQLAALQSLVHKQQEDIQALRQELQSLKQALGA